MSGFFNGASGRLAFIAALWALALLTPGSRPSAQGNLGRCVRGIQMLEFNTYDQAIHFFSTVIDQGLIPDDTMFRVLAERGRSYRRKGLEERVEADYAQALAVAGELFNQALISNPKSAFVHLYLGVLYGDQGRHGEAVEQLSEVIRIQPGRSLAHYNRGLSYIFLEQYAAARRDFDQAAELDPDFAATYYNRGLAKWHLQDYNGAIEDYSQALALAPEHADAYNNRGFAREAIGENELAVWDFIAAYRLQPDNKRFFNKLVELGLILIGEP